MTDQHGGGLKSLDPACLINLNTLMQPGVKRIARSGEGFFVEDAAGLGQVHSELRECYAYWRELCARSGGLPGRNMIQPDEVPRLLPHFRLIDLFEDGQMMPRCRLAGAVVNQLAGMEITGKYYRDIYDADTYQLLLDIYARIVERRLPYYLRAAAMFPGRDFINAERLIMPFGDESGAVVTVGGVTVLLDAA